MHVTMLAKGETPLLQPCISATSGGKWNFIDTEFKSIIAPIHGWLDADEQELAAIFASLLNAHLKQFEMLPENTSRWGNSATILHRL